MDIIDEAQSQLVIKSLNTEVGLWRLKVEQLQAENKELEKDRDAHSKIRQRHLVRCGKQSTLIEQLQAELKAKDEFLQFILRNIKPGVVTMQWVKSYIEHALKGDK